MAKKKKRFPINKSARYRSFIAERDKALETILNKSRAQMHDNLRGAFQAIKEKIAYRYSTAAPDSMAMDSSAFLNVVDEILKKEFQKTAALVGGIYIRMKMYSFTLASTGEAEAIGQAMNRPTKYNVPREKALEDAISNSRGENIGARIQLAFDRLRRKILDAVQLSRVQRSSVAEMLARIDRALPNGAFVKRPARVLKKITEAKKKKPKPLVGMADEIQAVAAANAVQVAAGAGLVGLAARTIIKAIADAPVESGEKVSISQGFVDDDTWREMVNYYLTEYVPTYQFRGPDSDSDYFYKDWELERDITHEFVASVRAGQDDAAKQNGIVDFQWIAVIDNVTCEDCCDGVGCVDFDGKSTSEVEELTGGKVVVPPAHFSCRCTIAPLLDTMPEAPASNAQEFDEWLNE